MTPSQQLTRARNCVHVYCQSHFPEAKIELRDSIFICDGFYRGRRFRSDQVTAVWFAEEDQLKIHMPDGECVASWDAAEMAANLERSKHTDQTAETEKVEVAHPPTLPMVIRQPQTQVAIRRAA